VPELPTTGTNSRSQLLTAGAALLLGVVLLLGGRNRRSLRSREH
jgi:LPXTG-motif cell wall-anchored protein